MKLKTSAASNTRKQCEMRDPTWELSYKHIGPSLEEICSTKPKLKDPEKVLVWTKDKGWEEVDATSSLPRNRRPRG